MFEREIIKVDLRVSGHDGGGGDVAGESDGGDVGVRRSNGADKGGGDGSNSELHCEYSGLGVFFKASERLKLERNVG